ncbi:nuclear transport factor 2 family protein [Sphingopyxis sp. BSN-002]|uniref:nuclear transport factor 2 family protein n=1 Tax=Sphingopyxis sp. BSN-002 TaxID=2911495 RepID=UPI001EDAE933|nr:nuclear transport factor 2 family protein [Sphingopyxis sp. BSN-002]UKK85573.1 nuclear transport factor 2 family protein [Sphingopyxis sp. BSN-002]
MSHGMAAVHALLDREAVAAVVTAYAGALDARDWHAYRALFLDDIAIDYGAIGSLVATVSADEWTNRCKALEGFDATAHQLHNIVATIDGDRATATSIVDAVHVVGVGDHALLGDLIGRYTHRLVRRDGWKIAGVTLTVVAYPAGKDAFDAAFAAARANFSGRNIA